MNQMSRTLAFVAAAAAVCVAAWASVPRTRLGTSINEVGTDMFREFKDPLSADRLEIIRFNSETADRDLFDVAKVNGVWSLPSRSNYPADAADQMAQAANALVDLKILSVESSDAASHRLFGVLDPADPDRKLGDQGVGTRVTMRKGTDILAEIIIGKEVEGQTDQRYVRSGRKGRDQVYVVKLDANKFTTKFADWIEKDLLKLTSGDIRNVAIHDYSAGLTLQNDGLVPFIDERMRADVAWNDKDFKWSLVKAERFDPQSREFQPLAIGENQELNSSTLNDLKFALDDLKIADVERKPEGMSRDLKADANLAKNREAIQSLAERGFIPVRAIRDGEESWDVLSSEGEVICGMRDGVEYVLRFGAIAGQGQEHAEKQKPTEGEPKDDSTAAESKSDDSAPDVNRYLLVMARFNEGLLERPELEPFPEAESPAPSGEDAASSPDQATVEASPGTEGSPADDEDQPTTEPTREGAPSDADGEEVTDEPAVGSDSPTPDAKAAESSSEEATPPQENEAAKETKPAAATDQQPSESAETSSTGTETTDAAPSDKEALDKAALEKLKREEIEKENQKRLDDFQEKITAGQKKAKELNDRFADWYYVIDNKTYDKIHLSWEKIVKDKAPPAGSATSGDDAGLGPGLGGSEGLNLEGP